MKTTVIALVVTLTSTSDAWAEPMSFKSVINGGNCGQCAWTIAQGEITADTPAALLQFLDENGRYGELVFDSPGGNLAAAIEMGRIIRENGLSTAIARSEQNAGGWETYSIVPGGTCESACAFAFLGGVSRYAYQGQGEGFEPRTGQLGMHQFYTPDGRNIPSADTQQIMGQVLLYMLDMGANAELLSIAAATPPDQMHYFTRDELIDLDVLTLPEPGPEPLDLFVYSGGLATSWGFELDGGALDRAIVLRCSAQASGWILKLRGSAFDPEKIFADNYPLDNPTLEIGGQRHNLTKNMVSQMNMAGQDVLELSLPGSLPVFAGQEFSFSIPGPRAVGWQYFGARQTLPNAETFSVLARACGD